MKKTILYVVFASYEKIKKQKLIEIVQEYLRDTIIKIFLNRNYIKYPRVIKKAFLKHLNA